MARNLRDMGGVPRNPRCRLPRRGLQRVRSAAFASAWKTGCGAGGGCPSPSLSVLLHSALLVHSKSQVQTRLWERLGVYGPGKARTAREASMKAYFPFETSQR